MSQWQQIVLFIDCSINRKLFIEYNNIKNIIISKTKHFFTQSKELYYPKDMNKKRTQKTNLQKESIDQTKQVKTLMTQGKILYEKAQSQSEYQQSRKLFNMAIIKSSSTQVLHLNHIYHMRGLCQFKLRNYDRAERDFQQAISISDDKSKIQFYNSLGKCKIQQINSSQEKMQSNQALSATTLNIQLEEGIKCFQKSLEFSNFTDGEAYYNLGLIYRRLKKNFQAIKQYSNAIKYLKPMDQYLTYIQRGICYRDIGEIQNSINDFLKALQIKKDDPWGNFHLGINYLLNLNYQSSLQRLSAATEANKTEPKFYNYKGLVLYMSGEYELCLSIFHQALKYYEQKQCKNSEVGQCWYNVGNTLLNLNRQDEAIEAFNKAKQFQIDQDLSIKLLYAQGRTYQLINSSQSITKFKECLQKQQNSNNNDLYLPTLYHLGLCQSKYNLLLDSIKSFTKIIQTDCNDKCVYEERGKVFLKNQMYKQALKDFQIVIGLDQTYSDIYYYRGMSKIYIDNNNMIQQALKDFFKAIQLGSKHFGIYNGISCAYLQGKKYQKALIYSNICLSSYPNTEDFLIQRSLIYLELEQFEKSIEDLTEALKINHQNPIIYYRRGLSLYKNKQYEKSIQDLTLSLKYQPNKNIQSDIYYHIGIANSNLEKYQQSIDPLTKALNIQIKSKYYHERAKCSILINQNLNALNDLNEVIKQQPENAFAYFRRGFANKALRLYQQAAQDFLKARELKPQDPRLIINKKQIYQTKYRKLCNAGQEE